jgi:hypothetical protein
VTYGGTLATSSDQDWYRMNLLGGRQVAVRVVPDNGCETEDGERNETRAAFVDRLGAEVHRFATGEEDMLHWTTPFGGGQFNLRLAGSMFGATGCSYTFDVTPADAVTAAEPAAPPLVAFPEPAEDLAHATGPLAGGVLYDGAIETSNDEEWGRMWLRPSQRVTAELTNYGGCTGNERLYTSLNTVAGWGSEQGITGMHDGEQYLGETHPNRRTTKAFSTGMGGEWAVRITGGQGCRWQLLITPAAAVSSTPLSVPRGRSPACVAAPARRSSSAGSPARRADPRPLRRSTVERRERPHGPCLADVDARADRRDAGGRDDRGVAVELGDRGVGVGERGDADEHVLERADVGDRGAAVAPQ